MKPQITMLQSIINLASFLDSAGFIKAAAQIDVVLTKFSAEDVKDLISWWSEQTKVEDTREQQVFQKHQLVLDQQHLLQDLLMALKSKVPQRPTSEIDRSGATVPAVGLGFGKLKIVAAIKQKGPDLYQLVVIISKGGKKHFEGFSIDTGRTGVHKDWAWVDGIATKIIEIGNSNQFY